MPAPSPLMLFGALAVSVTVASGVVILTNNSGSTSSSATKSPTITGGGGTVSIGPNGNANGGSNGGGNSGHSIGVTWNIDQPLILGRRGTLAVHIANQNSQAINVTSVVVKVNGVDKTGCDTTWLSVDSFSGSQRVEAKASKDIDLGITLNNKAVPQDACKGAAFSLTVNATAVQA
jgi:hypothetical protein